jgi:putative transposon-encoded protein
MIQSQIEIFVKEVVVSIRKSGSVSIPKIAISVGNGGKILSTR